MFSIMFKIFNNFQFLEGGLTQEAIPNVLCNGVKEDHKKRQKNTFDKFCKHNPFMPQYEYIMFIFNYCTFSLEQVYS
jgi:hypothetical protein